jgi:hypothetical protein
MFTYKVNSVAGLINEQLYRRLLTLFFILIVTLFVLCVYSIHNVEDRIQLIFCHFQTYNVCIGNALYTVYCTYIKQKFNIEKRKRMINSYTQNIYMKLNLINRNQMVTVLTESLIYSNSMHICHTAGDISHWTWP